MSTGLSVHSVGDRPASSPSHRSETPRDEAAASTCARKPGGLNSYVGRIGTLAVALGIGAAVATGLGTPVAHADQQESGTSTSDQAKPSRPGTKSTAGRSARSKATMASNTSRSPVVNSSPTPVSETRRSTSLVPSTEPEAKASAVEQHSSSDTASAASIAKTAPPIPGAAPTMSGARAIDVPAAFTVAPITAPAAEPLSVAPLSMAPLSAASTNATVQVSASAVAVPAAVAARAPRLAVATMLTKVLASLTNVVSGGTPAVPADTSLALMLGAARRKAVTSAPTASTRPTPSVEAEKMSVSPASSGRIVSDRAASGRSALALVGSGTASTTMTIVASTTLTIRAKASSGSPNMTVSIDGVPITTVVVKSTSYTDYTFAGAIPAGQHVISVATANATPSSTLYLDKVSTSTGAVGDQFSGKAGSAPNSSIWTSAIGTGWDSGIQYYSSANTYLDGQGHVVIAATKTSTGGYTSGRIQSANNLSLGYGTVTARIQVPQGQGLWPAFWLIGADEAAHIEAPTLVAVGTKDDIAGDPHRLAALLPRGEGFDIEGRDHMLAVGDRSFKKAVLEFLEANP